MGTTSTNKVEEKSLSTKKKSSAEANYFSLEEIHSTKNMQFFIFFSFFVLALTTDGAKTKKHAIKNAIDFFDEDAFLEHLKTLFATKEEVESTKTTLGDIGDRMCQVGQAGCWSASACGITSDISIERMRRRERKWLDMTDNWERWMSKRFHKTVNTKSISVTFPKAFPKAPSVQVAMYAAKLTTPKGIDSYGWDFGASDITTTGFTMNLSMLDRYLDGIYGVYIACSN